MNRRTEANVCPIAIVGSACLLPGADSPERFWTNLLAGSDQRTEGGPEVFGTDPETPGGWGDPEHRITATKGGFVREPDIDLSGLRLPAERLAALGGVVRWPLHVARQALADAGIGLEHPVLARTGLLLGNYSFPTVESVARCVPLIRDGVAEGLRAAGLPVSDRERASGPPETLWPSGMPASVVADALGLGGPRLALDAACASALYSLELGRRYLATGQVDVVLAGAVCAADPLLIHLCFSDLHAYPDNGVSQPFAADSTGIVTGQGAGLFVLKRLSDALRDGDTVHAVITSVGVGNDGAGAHLLAPNMNGQVDTYRLGGDTDVDYVECHATGTPLGDSTELRGLVEFFGSEVPLLGSVKGNVGHLLTVAGFTSVLKTVLAMRHGVIPATLTGPELIRPEPAEDVAERVVRENTPWPDTTRPRRAAVSAFGFGGANAHLVLDTPPAATSDAEDPVALPRMAVTGLGVRLAGIADVADLSRASRAGKPLLTDRTEERWHGLGDVDESPGGHLGPLRVDVRTYRIPPLALGNTNEQHLALFEAADQALAEAGIAGPGPGVRSGDLPPRRIGVVVAMEMEPWSHAHRARFDIGAFVRAWCPDLDAVTLDRLEARVRDAVHDPIDAAEVLSYIGNIMASRISASRNLTGPSFTVSGDVTVGAQALQTAALLLTDPTIEAVLVGAVDLAAGLENTLARNELARAAGEPLPVLGDGAAALVVTRATEESTVVIDGLGFGHGTDAAHRAVSAACDQAGTSPTDIEYVELTNGVAEVPALAEAYGGEPRSCAVSGLSPLVGDVQRATFLVGLVRAAVALREATLPAAPAGLLADAGTVLEGTPLFLAEAPQPWLLRERGGRRVAAVSGLDGESAAHAVLSSAVPGPPLPGDPDVLVVPVPADDPDAMAQRLRTLLDRIDNGATGAEVMREAVADPVTGRYRAVLVAEDTVRLRTEIAAAVRDLPTVLADGGEWATPAGSYCTGDPVGSGKVAFIYPGAFTSYPGMSRDLFRLFPDLLAGFESEAAAPAAHYQHAALFPRAAAGVRRQDLMRHEAAMIDDIPMMLAAGTNTAVLHTRLLRDVLGVRPDGAFGYSLGESSMLFALDVWAATARDDRALTASPLFQDRLRGAKTLIRDTWRLSPDLPDNRVWQSRVVLAPAEQVAKALAGHDRLYLTHVNTDNETVVAGDPAQLDEFAATTGFSMARAPANHVMHVDLVSPVRAELAALNDYPIGSGTPGAMLLSAYDYAPIPAETTRDRAALADRNSHTLCRPVDFPRLVRTAYQAGFRVFVEVGPAATCTRWVTEVLRTDDRSHVAVSLDRRGAATATALAGAVARLVSHGVPVRLEALLRPEPPRLTGLEVDCGGPSIVTRVRDAATAALAEAGPTESPVPTPAPVPAVTPAPTPPPAPTLPPVSNPLPEATVTPDTTQIQIPEMTHSPEMTQHPDVTRVPMAGPGPAAEPVPTPGPRPVADPAPIRASVDLVRALAGTVSRAHRAALATQEALAQRMLATLTEAPPAITAGLATPATLPPAPPAPPVAPPDRERPPGVRWDEADMLEFAGGRIANVFGPEFAEIDEYPVRVRLPEPPYLFVSRVISVTGTPGRFEPASIVTEYDIPHDAWYLVDGLVPCAVTIEAGQCDLLLISYLGIDFRNRGERVYRLLDSTLVFHGPLPRAGQTLRYEINIDRFVWNGDALLFFFNYRCYADGELILELLDACAGFFSADELENSLGVVTTDADRKRRAELTRTWFKPLVRTPKTSLTGEDLELLAAGRLAEVFGPAYDQSADGVNRSIRLPADMLRMIDEITRIDRLGGPRGIGALSAVKRLEPDGWYFRCHFTGDPVLAGSMVAEGGVQILQTYAMYLGLHMVFPDAEFQSVPGLTTSVKVRGQITPGMPEIRYEVEVTDVTLLPRPTVIADITVYDGDKPIISMKNFGVQVREKPGTPYRPGPGGVPPFLGRRNHLGEPAFINELHLAHAAKGDLGTAMGPEFDVYAQSRAPHIPNGDFQFVDRIMRLEGTRGQLRSGSRMVTEYDSPPEAWYYAQNSTPTMPNCVLMETSLQAAILCGYYLGATLDDPETQFSIRNLDGTASLVRDIDLRGKTIRHDSTMLFSSAAGDVLQKFRYELSADGEVFYRGESLFGYHTAQSLSQQAGLDNGKYVAPWIETQGAGAAARRLIVRPDDRWFRPDPRTGLRLADGLLRMVDHVDVVSNGGTHGKGYLFGSRTVDDADWYFDCHFHRDPVMPGSLGVEAVLQALQVYVIDSGLAEGMGPVEFRIPLDTPYTWRYRGQILRGEGDMTFEVHVRDVRRTDTGELVVVGDASVWKPGLRIYELTGVAIAVRPARSETTR